METIVLSRPIEIALLFHRNHGQDKLSDQLKEIEFQEDTTSAWINPNEPDLVNISGDNGLIQVDLKDVIESIFTNPEITIL